MIAMRKPIVGFLFLALLVSCNTLKLTEGGANELTTQVKADFLNELNAARHSARTCIFNNEVFQAIPASKDYTSNAKLELAALSHARWLEQNSINITTGDPHDGAGDGSAVGRIAAAGYQGNPIGENIAAGQPDVVAVVNKDSDPNKNGFMNSPNRHCNNVMDADFTQVGLAKRGAYWVVTFGKPN
jgi:uncharacterized protein YkwD